MNTFKKKMSQVQQEVKQESKFFQNLDEMLEGVFIHDWVPKKECPIFKGL